MKKRNWIDKINWVANLKRFMRTHTFPGLDNISIYHALRFFFNELQEEQLMIRASAVSFHTILATFPSIICFFTLIPYIPLAHFQENLYAFMQEILPHNAYQMLNGTIQDIINIPRGGLFSLGFLLTIFFSTNGVNFLIQSFHKNSKEYRQRGFIRNRWLSLKLTLLLFSMLVVSVSFIIMGNELIRALLNYLEIKNAYTMFIFSALKWIMIVMFFFFSYACLYYYGGGHKGKWMFLSPGATLAMILSVMTSLGFSFFVNNFSHYNTVYGAIGTIIVMMIWIQLNSLMILVGYELNDSIYLFRKQRDKSNKHEV